MKKKAIIIVIAVIAALALLITGTILLLKSKIINIPGSSSDKNSITNSQNSDVDKNNSSDNSNSGSTNSNTDPNNSKDPSSSTSPVTNGNITTFTAGNATGRKGSKISIPVEVSSNQGFMACLADVKYNSEVLKYTGYKKGKLLNDPEIQASDGIIKFMSVYNNDVKTNGTMIYLEFEIITDKAQVSPIEVNIDKGFIANEAEQLVPVKTVNGSVTVK